MKAKLAAALTIAIFVLSSAAFLVPAYATPKKWVVYYREPALHPSPQSLTALTSGIGEFQFPDANAPQYVSYLWEGYTNTLAESNTITATINIIASSDAVFSGRGSPSSTFVRLFFQANLPASTTPTCAGPGYNENNYWWSNPVSYTFVAGGSGGNVILSVPLNPASWSNMCGHLGSNPITTFDAALAKVDKVGLSFGSAYGWASGVGVSFGTATFQLLDYEITP